MNHHDEASMAEAEADPIPEARALEGATGTPAVLADGNTWLLPDGGLCNDLDGLRDRIDDQSRLRGAVDMQDVVQAAFILLRANYDVTAPEAAGLILKAESQPLADAVREALYGAESGRSYTRWAASALWANGIDPAAVPGHLRRDVLDHLVATGRAIPAAKFIDSAVAAPRLAALRARAARLAAPPAGDAAP